MKKKLLILSTFLLSLTFVGIYLLSSNKSNFTFQAPFVNTSFAPLPTYHTLNIDSVFDNSLIASDETVTLIATGDVIPARVVNMNTIAQGNFLWPWEKTADFVKDADLTLINLEAPIFDKCPQTNTGFTFCGEDEHIQGLIAAGVDVANFANNHSGNYGEEGLNETIGLLEKNNIAASGYSKIGYKTIKGTTFAFLGYNDVGAPYLRDAEMSQAINDARNKADVVVVSFHWGTEYKTQPDQRQVDLARLAIDSGADLIIGNHPHWIQPVEIYRDKFIMYAHGNFIFDQMWSEETKKGVVGKYVFLQNKLIDVEYYPIYIEDYGQPRFLEGGGKEMILEELEKASLEL